jgi:hypothetical protein
MTGVLKDGNLLNLPNLAAGLVSSLVYVFFSRAFGSFDVMLPADHFGGMTVTLHQSICMNLELEH